MADKKFVVKNGLQSDDKVLINTSTDNNVDELQVNGSIRATGQIKSVVPNTGTAPFTVDSTTVVQNLNADLLDGQEGSYYQNADNINAGTLASARLPDLAVSDFGSAAIVTEADAITSNDNDTSIPTSAAVIDYVSGNFDQYTSWNIGDGSTTQAIASGDTLTVSGTNNEVDVAVSATDTLTIGLPNDVTIANDLTIGGTGKIIGPSDFYIDPAGDDSTNGTVIIQGSLTVKGTTTTVDSNTVAIGDSILVLNSDETGTPSQNGGLELERGTANNAFLIWDETSDTWRVNDVSGAGTTYYDLLTSNDTLISVTDGSTTTDLTSGGTATFAAQTGHLDVAESSGTITYSLPNSGVTAASYGGATAIPVITVDDQGRVTAASTAAISTSFDISDGTNTQTISLGDGDSLTFSGTSSEIEVAVGATDTVTIGLPDDVTIGQHLTVSDDLIQGDHVYRSASLDAHTGTTGHTVASFSATTFASAELNIVAVRGNDRHITKMLVTHNGTTASATEFGEIITSSAFATYDVAITSGNVVVTATQIGATTTDYRVSQVLTKN